MNWKPFKSFGEYLELIGTVTGQPIPAALGSLIKGGVIGAEFADVLTPKYSKLEKHIKQYIEEKYPEHHKKLEKEIEPVLERINQHYVTEFCSVKLDERDYVLDEIMVRYHGENRESCREILRWTLEEIHTQIQDVAPTVATMIKLYGKIDSVEEKIDEILEFLREQFGTAHTVKEDPSQFSITDHAHLFQKKFKMSLFLEEGEDGAKLYQVFVKPQIASSQQGIISFLSDWLGKEGNIPLLLYGKPGVGKSTMTAFLNAVASRDDDFWNTLTPEEQTVCEALAKKLENRLHPLVLNLHIDKISHENAWESVKSCFGVMSDDAYDGKILILDGLDEVCVLKQGFEGIRFLKKLCGQLTEFAFSQHVKILITSRRGYFSPLNNPRHLIEQEIEWTEAEMQEWCE
ncbi:MAG: ATP-binding protein, partial [Oscillospiraceae bacterium]|nr:ATP-binding protein [Oscillospiraceae bacterium]